MARILEGAMPHGPRPISLALSAADRETLLRLMRRPKTAQALALRAHRARL